MIKKQLMSNVYKDDEKPNRKIEELSRKLSRFQKLKLLEVEQSKRKHLEQRLQSRIVRNGSRSNIFTRKKKDFQKIKM